VNDWYGEDYYSTSPSANPQGPEMGSSRVLGGGSWDSGDNGVRAADRSSDSPGYWSGSVGFRCVRSL